MSVIFERREVERLLTDWEQRLQVARKQAKNARDMVKFYERVLEELDNEEKATQPQAKSTSVSQGRKAG